MSAVLESTTPSVLSGHHQYIALNQLRASPLNHRKTFPKEKMAELADSIRSKGVIQPIIARPVFDVTLAPDGFEVVAGERRFRAAKAAGLVDIPAIVRSLSDTEVLELQVIENGQREDPHPLEEAEGYEALLKCKHPDGRPYTVDEIAAKVSKSRSTIFARLKLCSLCAEARKAFYAGELEASVALLIARIGHHDTQRQALKDVIDGRGEPMSYRQAHQHLLQTYMLKLAAAPFDLKDAELLPAAGDCVKCPKRTGNQADLFGDVKSADVCTDPKCFDDKRQAHYGKAVKELEAKGKKVIHGDAAKKAFPNWDAINNEYLSDRYARMTGHTFVGHRQMAVRDVLGADYEPLLLQHPATGKIVEVATQQAVQAAAQRTKKTAVGAKVKASKPAKPKGPDVDDLLTERLATLIHKRAPKEFGKAWFVSLAQELVEHLSTRDLEAVALAWGWKASAFKPSGGYGRKKLPAEVAKLGERDLMLLMFHIVFAIGQWTREPVLKLFGIKEKDVREQIIEERKVAAKKAREDAKAKKVTPPAKKAKLTGMAASHAMVTKAKEARAAKKAITPLINPGQKLKRGHADFMKKMTPSADLAAIVGAAPLPRTEVTSKLWAYIKKHGLQDKTNRRMINVDDALKPVLGNKKQVSMFEMTKFVAKHLK